jgi:hypothetical protein
MNNIYSALNDAQVNPEDYDAEPLSAFEKKAMKQGFRRRAGLTGKTRTVRWAAAAACLVCLISFSQTTFAQAAISNILQSINLGHSAVIQVNPSQETKPDHSKYYDKDGKPLTGLNSNGPTDLYDAKGNKIGTVSGRKEKDQADKPNVTMEKDLNSAISQVSFTVLLPKDLPSGYKFEKAGLYKQEDGKVDGNYIDLYYTNGSDQIIMNERKLSATTTFAMATDDTVKKVTVNGHVAALTGEHDLDWEANGCEIGLVANGLSTDQLMKLAGSVK